MTLIVSIKDKDIELIKFPIEARFVMSFYTIRDEYIIYYRGIPFTGRIVYSAVNEDMGEEMFQGISKERISSFTDNDKFIIKDYINKISKNEDELGVPRIKWKNATPPIIEKDLDKKSSVLSKEPDKKDSICLDNLEYIPLKTTMPKPIDWEFNKDKFAEKKEKVIHVNKNGWDDMSPLGCIAWAILFPIAATLIYGLMNAILTLGF